MVRKDSFTLAQLENMCTFLNLSPEPTKNRKDKITGERLKVCSKKDYLKSLQNYFLERDNVLKNKKFLLDFMSIEKLKRAYPFKNLDEKEQQEIVKNSDYIIERQLGGLRFCLYWSIQDGILELYPEAISKDNYLPKDCSDILEKNKVIEVLFKKRVESFCIVGEILPFDIFKYNQDDYYGGMADVVLNMLDNKCSWSDYSVYLEDIISYGNEENFLEKTLDIRQKYLEIVLDALCGIPNIKHIERYNCLTEDAYERSVSLGYDGIVLKNKYSLYSLDDKVNKDWIKMSVSKKYGKMVNTVKFDAFVTGYKDGVVILGTFLLENGVIMKTKQGENYICNVFVLKNMPKNIESLFVKDEKLLPEVYGKVVTLSIPVIHREDNISNATFSRFNAEKSVSQCIIDKDFLNEVILY